MTLDALIMSAGAFVAILPFLGFPNSWDNILFLLAGIFIIGLGIVTRRRGLGLPEEQRKKMGAYTESTPVSATHEELA